MTNNQTQHPNVALISELYRCFQKLDGEGMASCYHEDATFSDPVFTHLRGNEVGDMWRMMCANAREFKLDYRDVIANDGAGSAHWKADYKFSGTGRLVSNHIDSQFNFKEGKIISQTDSFNFWKWSRMALGPVGYALGWTPLIRRKVQKQAMSNLRRFIEKQSRTKQV
jgi:ketosteroid isomerase-like protein